jgi:hypothetical protein
VLVLAHARRQLAAVGAEVAAGRLADPDDVFFLTLREARQAVQCIRWSAPLAYVAAYLQLTEPGSTRT